MDFSAPSSALLPRTDGEVLRVLAGTTRPLSGREVARLSRTSPNGAWKVLRRLAENGLVAEQEAGRGAAVLYTLNREHVAADAVELIADLRRRFIDRVRNALDQWKIQAVHASLFGSAARGEGDAQSDVDLFIVRPEGVREDDNEWRSQINTLAQSIHAWSGNHAGIAEVSKATARRLRRERPPIIHDLERDAIVLIGVPLDELIRSRQRRR